MNPDSHTWNKMKKRKDSLFCYGSEMTYRIFVNHLFLHFDTVVRVRLRFNFYICEVVISVVAIQFIETIRDLLVCPSSQVLSHLACKDPETEELTNLNIFQ